MMECLTNDIYDAALKVINEVLPSYSVYLFASVYLLQVLICNVLQHGRYTVVVIILTL